MTLRMTEEEFAEWQRRRGKALPCAPARNGAVRVQDMDEKPKRNKYGNKKTVVDGMKFDSQHEAAVYQQLMARVRAGELKCVCRQVPFDLPGGIRYIADFVTVAPDMTIEGVYDAKSAATRQNRVYINKKKQVKACWDIDIREV